MEIPEYVEDFLGQKVYPGDIITYGVLLGRSASLSLGVVDEFTISKGYFPSVKVKVRGVEKRWYGEDKGKLVYKNPGFLEASNKRFVLMPEDTKKFLPTGDKE